MAVVAMAKYGQAHHHKSSKKATKEKLIRVLLDSGSDGDLLIHQKGSRCHDHGIRQMESSTQKEGASSQLGFLNTAIAKSS